MSQLVQGPVTLRMEAYHNEMIKYITELSLVKLSVISSA